MRPRNLIDLFANPPSAPSRRFKRIARDDVQAGDVRNWLFSLWREFQPLADPHFLSEFPRETLRRFWEMYLGCYLLRRFRVSAYGKGSDFLVETVGARFHVEATLPDAGVGDDAVPEMIPNGEFMEVPHRKMALRFSQAISTKHANFARSKELDRAAEADGFVIAINEYDLLNGWMADNRQMPLVVRALAAFGNLSIVYDRKTFKRVASYHEFVPEVAKLTQNAVRMDYFLNNEFSSISAVLVSRVTPYPPHNDLGRDFIVIHNPMAKNPIDDGAFAGARQMRIEFMDERTRLREIERPKIWDK